MQKRTKIVSSLIILTALGLAIFILTAGKFSDEKSETANSTKQLGSLYESLPKTLKNPSGVNATEQIAQKLARELIEKNPNGPSLLDSKNIIEGIDPETFINDFLKEELESFDPSDIQPIILVEELNLKNDSSVKALETYFQKLQIALTDSPRASFLQTITPKELLIFADHLKTIGDRLYALPVPVILAPWHAEEISLVKAQENIFRRAAYAEDDPLSAYLALQMLPTINDGFLKVNNGFSEIIEKHNLQI